MEAAQERSGEAVWRLVKAGGLEPGRGKWLGELVKGSGVEAGRQEFSGGFSRNVFGSWSSKLVSKLVEGSGLEAGAGKWSWNPEKLKAGSVR